MTIYTDNSILVNYLFGLRFDYNSKAKKSDKSS